MEIVVDGKVRQPVFHGKECYVSLRRGEVYAIRVRNQSDEMVRLRLLVDGLNTLPELQPRKAVTVEPIEEKPQYHTAVRVSLDEARAWILDPGPPRIVQGFFSGTGEVAPYNEFLVTDATDALAYRKGFTDQIGLITAAFYAPDKSAGRGIGTTLGEARQTVVKERETWPVGKLLAIVQIRYASPEAIARLKQ